MTENLKDRMASAKAEAWEDDEVIITIQGSPVGMTLSKREGAAVVYWLKERGGITAFLNLELLPGLTLGQAAQDIIDGKLVKLDEDQTWPCTSVREHVRRAETAFQNRATGMGFQRVKTLGKER